ncbi:MAG TPA: hypothetical protein VHN77_09505 [Phycisphaerales bacterium]|nr:hypothetical protein [Phycisphaerales bacterium]
MKQAFQVVLGVSLAVVGVAGAQTDPGLAAPDQPVVKPSIELTAKPPTMPADRQPIAIELMRKEGARSMQHVQCGDAQRFIFAINWLPAPEPRTLYRNKETREWLSQEQFNMLDDAGRQGLELASADMYFYYYTRYGSPVAYARPLDILCAQLGGGTALRGKKVVDFGFGGIGHLRLLASIGVNVTGVEVDPLLRALYSSPDDVGLVPGTGMTEKTPDGVLRLVYGQWPADPVTVTEVGDGYDVFISKNTLKRGYVHPEPPEGQTVDPRRLINLGVDDEQFVSEVARILNPGGLWVVYNICPAPAKEGEAYIPWADGRFPFDRALVEKHGFEVIAWDQDDKAVMSELAKAMYWDKPAAGGAGMDLENDLFAHYTLLKKSAQIEFEVPVKSTGTPASQ